MPSKDPRIDEYISKSAKFAQPILKHLRKLVHLGCPQVQETMKWSFPHFDYKGIMCSMAAFKNHCSFGFWKATLMTDEKELLNRVGKTDMAHFDKIASLNDLPPDEIIVSYIKEAVRLNEEEVKLPPKKIITDKKELAVPEDLNTAFKKNKKALSTFESFSPSHKKEYIQWITEAKTDATREKRLETAIKWMSEGKGRHWKYERQLGAVSYQLSAFSYQVSGMRFQVSHILYAP
jgi:uncharacterized protein YdeI (YjbR/CyaY-like superfamily)